MWCGKCYTSSVVVRFPVKEKALNEHEDLEDPNKRERLQACLGENA
jgi:hypothetical protein